ncbi:MAG TPA: porin family protein [Bacteroidales bacterium]|nr:porin family protein [Bacteroidales bacterium]
MLKKIVLLKILILAVTAVFAQKIDKGLSFSLKSGITAANMYGADAESETFLNGSTPETFYANHPASDQFKSGFNFGVLADYRVCRFFSIGLGAGYIQKGAQINATESWNSSLQSYESVEGEIYWNQNFWTLEIPLTLYIPFGNNDFYIQGGFFKGFLIKSEEKGDIRISDNDYEYNRDRRANDTEPGFFIGCGYLYSLKRIHGNLFAEVLWSRSIIQSPGSNMIPNPQYYYNQTVSINIGYRYNLSKRKK